MVAKLQGIILQVKDHTENFWTSKANIIQQQQQEKNNFKIFSMSYDKSFPS